MTRKIAVIGSGISGLTAAYLLQNHGTPLADGRPAFEVEIFESADRIGGHTATVPVAEAAQTLNIDTGFIVYNDWTYPNFIRLLDEIGVHTQPTNMSFSVSCANTGLEYSGNGIDTLFAQRRNVFNPAYLRMLWLIARFNKQAVAELEQGQLSSAMTLGQYLKMKDYSGLFVSHYLIPMCSAIWSASKQDVLDFPLVFFVNFFKNHGLLSITNRPQWRVIAGGSNQYLSPLSASFSDKIRLNSSIKYVLREDDGVTLAMRSGEQLNFDGVIFACHSDQALKLIANPSPSEASILAAIPYRNNRVVLHTDPNLLPKNRKTWAAWNYLLAEKDEGTAVLTYNMNILQSLESQSTYCVTLNAEERINPASILGTYDYAHPCFSLDAISAQGRWGEINGQNSTWYCGAYWANGFHEDGVVSAKRVANALGVQW